MIGRLFYLMIVGVLLFTVDGLGQNTWVKTFGGSKGYEWGYSITITKDSGYIVTGTLSSNDGDFMGMNNGRDDIFVLKINSKSEIVWKKTIGGSINERGSSITTTNDSGYVLTGYSSSDDGDFLGFHKGGSDITVIKLRKNGNINWKKTFGGSNNENGSSIITTNDSGYVLTGHTSSNDGDFNGMNNGRVDIFIIKLDSNGNMIWKKTLGGTNDDYSYSITTTKDGGYVLTGYTSSNDGDFKGMNNGSNDFFIIKLDSNGSIVWKRTFGGSNNEYGLSIVDNNNQGYILTGGTTSNDGDFRGMNIGGMDIFVTKIDSNGDIVWKKTYGGSVDENGLSITTTIDGGIVLSGITGSIDGDFLGLNKGNRDIFVMKLDSNGDILWKKVLGGNGDDQGNSIINTISNGYVLTGRSTSNDGDFIGMNKGGNDIFVMKLDSNGNLNNTTSINEFSEPTTTLSVHPNPFSNSTTVSYKVYTPSNVRIELLNTLGQIIEVLREDYTDIGTYQLPLNVSTLSSGMYSVRMRSDSMNELVPVWVVR